MEAVENYCSKAWRTFVFHQLSYYCLALLCFLVFLLISQNSDVYWEVIVKKRFEEATNSPSPADRCNGKRIYMYQLPAKFNTQILEQCDKQLAHWINFCPHVENEGFGQYINNSACNSWYRTDPYMLEVIFHARMQRYPCLTKSPLQAYAFFIPYYSGLDALRFLYGKDMDKAGDQGKELVAWLEEEAGMTWKRRGGHDHFIVMGRTAWDFSRDLNTKQGWGTSFNVLPEMANVTSLLIERRAWSPSSKEQAIPYPTSFHPPSLSALQAWLSHVRLHPRSYLFSFSGASRSADSMGSIRNVILDECLHSKSECALVNCHDIRCAHNPQPIMQAFLESQFCLQPPGDTPTRRSTFDGLIAGCIPVFFQNESAYTQYTWHLPGDPTFYSVFISQADVEGGRRIKDVLETYSRERILQMRENIISLIHGLIYMSSSTASESPLYPDAFMLSLEGMLRRLHEKRIQPYKGLVNIGGFRVHLFEENIAK